MPAWQSAGEPSPGDAWTPLLVAKDVRVDGAGARAGRLSVIYRAARASLGKEVAVRVDGEVALKEPIVALSGSLRVAAPAGARRVEVEGLGEAGVAYTDAPPANGGAIVRRRDVFELTRARPMTYEFKQEAGETLHLVLFVVTPGENADYRIRYRPRGGEAGVAGGGVLPAGDDPGRRARGPRRRPDARDAGGGRRRRSAARMAWGAG